MAFLLPILAEVVADGIGYLISSVAVDAAAEGIGLAVEAGAIEEGFSTLGIAASEEAVSIVKTAAPAFTKTLITKTGEAVTKKVKNEIKDVTQ